MSDPQIRPFQFVVETPEPCTRIIKVAVPASQYTRQYEQHLGAAVRNHERPGFRKGKTPRSFVEKELRAHLRVEAFESLVPQAYRAAVIEHNLMPITDPELQNVVFDEGKDMSFDLVVEVRPEVTAVDYEGLPVKELPVEVHNEEIDEFIERLRDSRAVLEPASHPAAEGDQVIVDLVPLRDDGTPDEERRAAEQQLIVGDPQNLPVFNEALIGAEVGLRRDISVEYPEDYPSPDLRSKTVVFNLSVTGILQKVLPEVDDAFASGLHEGQTLLELRGRIREGLLGEARRRAAEQMDAQILDRLLERNEVPVPPSLVKSWLEKAIMDMHKRNDQLSQANTDDMDRAYREAFKPLAEREIKGLFLLDSVRRQEAIGVSDEEVEERIAAIAAQNGFDLEKYSAFLAKNDERKQIERDILERKTYAFLLSRAKTAPAEQEPQDVRADEEQG